MDDRHGQRAPLPDLTWPTSSGGRGTAASPKDRARTFAKALGREVETAADLLLGRADLLVGRYRQQLIDEVAADPDRHRALS